MATTPEKTVLFYCDTNCDSSELPSDAVKGTVARHLGAVRHQFVPPVSAQGFQSGIDWDELVAEQGAVAVVVFYVNDACLYGVSLEARNAGLPTYELELFLDGLFALHNCSNLVMSGKRNVSVPGITPI